MPHDTVKKHVNVLQFTKENFPLEEIRLLNSCLFKVNQRKNIVDTEFEINLFKFAELNKVPLAEAYNLAVFFTDKWLKATYQVITPDGAVHITPLLSRLTYEEENKRILIMWNSAFVSLISGDMVPGTFIKSDIRMSLTSSKTRYNLYEELQKYIYILFAKNRGSFDITFTSLREASGISETQYKEYKKFNEKILKPTLEEIHSTLGIKIYAEKRRSWNFVRFSLKSPGKELNVVQL